jgi:tRNA(Arg) A34 adenosine deaminase TadA
MSKKRYVIMAICYDKKHRMLGVGVNSYTKTHPLQKYFAKKVGHGEKECLHAEIAAILRCKQQAIYKIVVKRYNALGQPANAKPCSICQEAIKAFGIKVVEYT